MKRSPSSFLRDHLFAPVDATLLVFFRIAFGSIMMWEVWRYLDMNRISRYFIDPAIHFTYYGFDWVRPWAGNGMYWHFYALGLLALMITVGFCYRVATTLFFLGFTYVFLLDQTQYLNHFYLVSLVAFLLIFVPTHTAFSVDAALHPKLRSPVVPAWTLWLLRFQIAVPYFFGGIAKLGPDWLSGEPMRTWLAKRSDFPVLGPYFHEEWMVYSFVLGGLLLDLLVVPMLLWRPTRVLAFLLATSFHLLNAQLFTIGIFPWFMLCATLLFVRPETPRRLWHALRGKLKPAPIETEATTATLPAAVPSRWTSAQRGIAGALAAYMAVQVLVPFRHLLYPGNVDWTEEGHRFSWHMKLRDKQGQALFLVKDPVSGHVSEVYPEEYLTLRQCEKMSTRPDMILQFCHYLAEQLRQPGQPPMEVRAETLVSLNGREPQPIVNPTINLAAEPRTLQKAPWIMPLEIPLSRRALPGLGNQRFAGTD